LPSAAAFFAATNLVMNNNIFIFHLAFGEDAQEMPGLQS